MSTPQLCWETKAYFVLSQRALLGARRVMETRPRSPLYFLTRAQQSLESAKKTELAAAARFAAEAVARETAAREAAAGECSSGPLCRIQPIEFHQSRSPVYSPSPNDPRTRCLSEPNTCSHCLALTLLWQLQGDWRRQLPKQRPML